MMRLAADADHGHTSTLERSHFGCRQAKGNEAIAFPEAVDPNRFDLVRSIDGSLDLPGLMESSVLQDATIDIVGIASPCGRADADDWGRGARFHRFWFGRAVDYLRSKSPA